MKNLKRNTLPRFTAFVVFVMIALVGLFGFTWMSLLPGPLSDQVESEAIIGGYHSHAEFEMGCGHCHSPIHCVSSTKCQDCHLDVAEQRADVSGLHGNLPDTSRCNNCHVEHKGRENDIRTLAYTNVNHYKLAGFSLDKHQVDYQDQPMSCTSCHSQDNSLSTEPDCVTCHVQQDHDRTALHVKLVGSNCTGCHDGVDRMKDFVHDTIYPLQGEHAQADCAECHIDQVFAGTPQDCVSCHHEPDIHAGEFGEDCARCHNAVAWAPAYLIQHTFELQHTEDEPALECQECHITKYSEHTCIDCHDADDPMHAAHVEYQVDETQACAECHPTGAPDEALDIMDKSTPGQQGKQSPGQGDQTSSDLANSGG